MTTTGQERTGQERRPGLPGTALALIHEGRAPTRSALTAALGVSRATAGAVTSELRDLGLIAIGAGDRTTGAQGRPSHRLTIAPGSPVAVAAEVHRDGFRVALVGLGAAIVAVRSVLGPVAEDPEQALTPVAATAAALLRESGRECVGVALAVPFAVAEPAGTVVGALHIGWPTGANVRQVFGALVRDHDVCTRSVIVNDGNALALGEHRHGAGRGSGTLLVVEAGRQGVGSALVLDGRLYAGSTGLGMEAGHVSVDPNGRPCRCGNRGCLDVEADAERFLAALGRPPVSGVPVLDQAVGVLRAGYASDARVRAAATLVIERLGLGLASLVNVLNPDRVLLGGLHQYLLEAAPALLRAQVAERTPWGRGVGVPLVPCALEDGILIGAAEVAWQPVLDNPALLRPDSHPS
jgi:predicted NBD/HSP70 family sugar kinase